MYPVLSLFLLALNAAAIGAQGTPSCGNASAKLPLYIAYYTATTGTFVSSGTIPAVDLALELINDEEDLLPGYTLGYGDIYDTKVGSLQLHRCPSFGRTRTSNSYCKRTHYQVCGAIRMHCNIPNYVHCVAWAYVCSYVRTDTISVLRTV